jgi:hypothetical protein
VIGPSIASGAAGWQEGRIAHGILGQHRLSEYPSQDLHRMRRRRELDASYSQSHPGTKALNSGVWGGAPELSHQAARAQSPQGHCLGGIGYMVSLHTQVSYPIVAEYLKATKAGRNSRK